MRVLVCGGRDYGDRQSFYRKMDELHRLHSFSLVIEGGASGADALAGDWATRALLPFQTYKADWRKHGRAAGPLRNKQMLTEGKPDLVVAFPGGRGTADMVRQARAAGVRVIEVS